MVEDSTRDAGISRAVQIAPGVYVLDGAVNTGLLVSGGQGLLIDCCDTVTPERLHQLGVDVVDMILCTQHRRPNVAGARHFVDLGADLIAPAAERHLFEDVIPYWHDPANRWHIYHHQPSTQILTEPLAVARDVGEGDTIEWHGFTIQVLETPGATQGSISYLVQTDDIAICFCGDVLYTPGQVWDFYSFQKGRGDVMDYHGFLGSLRALVPSLQKVGVSGANLLVPSHGKVIEHPYAATGLTLERLDAARRSHDAVSALHHYFPGLLRDTVRDPWRIRTANTAAPPDFVRRIPDTTSFVVVSDSGAALLIDCGSDLVLDVLHRWQEEGTVADIEGCWITHYHDDHVDALGRGCETLGFPVLTDEHVAEILEHPDHFLLPCISQVNVSVSRKTHDGESWQWHEFTLTAFHFPGQSLYHSGLLVEGHGVKVFFAGDSGAPSGLDDYCCANRNFLGAGRGFRRCIDIWRRVCPDFIINQHQDEAFVFDDQILDYLDTMLEERERLFAAVLPWSHPNFGTDEHWVRAYPYEQTVTPGTPVALSVCFTNHGPEEVTAAVEPVLPTGWSWDETGSSAVIRVPALTDGLIAPFCARPDGIASLQLDNPTDTPFGQYVVPIRVTWGDRYLGQIRHVIINVSEE
jgi:glyoxylase-like metal-dependent hydrolase (beta-lactamase superfamily II)